MRLLALLILPVIALSSASAQTAESDTARAFLEHVRGGDPLLCALASRTIGRHHGWWREASDIAETMPAVAELAEWSTRRALDPPAIAVLAEALDEADPCSRELAALRLGVSRDSRAVDALRDRITISNPGARAAAVRGLGFAESEHATSDLIERLDDEVPAVRAAAAWALGRIEDPAALDALVESLAADPDATVRRHAAQALGEIGEE